jgi:hypothetical protein
MKIRFYLFLVTILIISFNCTPSQNLKTNNNANLMDGQELLKSKTENIDNNYLLHSFVSEVETKTEGVKIKCKSFLTEGMTKVGQQEVILTIAVPEKESEIQYLSTEYILPLFNIIYEYAKKGIVVTDGGHTSFAGESNILGFKGVVYAQHLKKISEKVPEECLSITLLYQKEKIASMKMGYMRVLTMLGLEKNRYPFPLWNEINRPETNLLGEMLDKTLLTQPLASLPMSNSTVYYSQEVTRFEISRSFLKTLKPTLKESLFSNGYLVVLPSFDLDIQVALTWPQEGNATLFMGVMPDKVTKPLKIMGSVLMLSGGEEKDEVLSYEDGFGVFMTDKSWKEFVKSFNNQENYRLDIKPSENDFFKSKAFELVWKD